MMLPISELPEETLRGLEGVAFDVDDTVTEHGRLTSRALAAMERLAASGLSLVAVTGRPLGWVEIFMTQWPISIGIGENGAGWFVRRGAHVEAGLFVDDVDALAAARERAFAIGRSVAPEVPIPADGWARRCDAAFDVGETRRASPEEIRRLDAALRDAGFHTVTSSIHLHAALADWDKAKGLVRAVRAGLGMDLQGEARRRWLYVGDSPNDAAAFAYFPCSVGVANVREHASSAFTRPRYVTEAARSAGFAELADLVVAARETR